jgi:hypothetical protein
MFPLSVMDCPENAAYSVGGMNDNGDSILDEGDILEADV